jgi:hypothetical protein
VFGIAAQTRWDAVDDDPHRELRERVLARREELANDAA